MDEYAMRKDLFAKVDAEIAELNAKHNPLTFFGHNWMSDLTDEELESLTDKNMASTLKAREKDYPTLPYGDASNQLLPMTFCFCCELACTNVGTMGGHGFKHGVGAPLQNKCQSAYAFASMDVMGANYAKKYGGMAPSLSVQQIISCSGFYGNRGCSGGWHFWAWEYA